MAYGMVTIDGMNYDEIWYGVMLPGVDSYREVNLPILDNLAMPWDLTVFPYFISEKMGFQPLAKGQLPDSRKLDEGWMIPRYDKWGVGVMTDRDTLEMGTSRQILAALNRPFMEDNEEALRRMLHVMMRDPGALNAEYGFYNGTFSAEEKITAPPRYQQNTFSAGHSHYVTTPSMSVAFIGQVRTLVREHGHKGRLAGFISSPTRERFEALVSVTAGLSANRVSEQTLIDGFDDQFHLLGVDWYVTEMQPDDYGLVVQVDPEEEGQRPMLMFEPPNMRGLRLHPGTDALHPLIKSYFDRWGGWKVWQRGMGVAFQITTGAYTNPTFV